jgi:hypothetical protein
MRQAGQVARVGEMTNVYKILVGKPEGRRPLGRRRRRWKDNIKLDLKAKGCEGADSIYLSRQGPVAGSCEHGNGLSGYIKGGELFEQLNDCYLLHGAGNYLKS